MIEVILFDFDGVIAESVDIKTTAFGALFKDEDPDDVTAIVDYHKKHGGISRTNKIIHYYKNILKRELTDQKLRELEDEFASYVKEAVIQAPYVDGALDFIKNNHKKYDFYIISGTPQDELVEIVSKRELSPYFLGLYGSPPGKAELINALLADKGYSKDKTLFIGDSADDLEGALKAGVSFVGRIDPSRTDKVFDKIKFPTINSIHEFESVLSKLDSP